MKGPFDPDRASVLVAHGCITAQDACDGKQRYPNRNDATHAAKGVSLDYERKVVSYRCPFCEFWHLSRLKHGETERYAYDDVEAPHELRRRSAS